LKELLFYFPDLSDQQKTQFEALQKLYIHWNAQINVISRKDTEQFYLHHVLHSLSLAKLIRFVPHTQVMDLGTGGGFPGIPLAILFPEVNFYLVDSIGKKIKVVEQISESLGLSNVFSRCQRAEELEFSVDFIVSRAVAPMESFIKWTENKFNREQKNSLPNGWLCLKGGNLNQEMANIKRPYIIHEIAHFFHEPFFETKKIVYVRGDQNKAWQIPT